MLALAGEPGRRSVAGLDLAALLDPAVYEFTVTVGGPIVAAAGAAAEEAGLEARVWREALGVVLDGARDRVARAHGAVLLAVARGLWQGGVPRLNLARGVLHVCMVRGLRIFVYG